MKAESGTRTTALLLAGGLLAGCAPHVPDTYKEGVVSVQSGCPLPNPESVAAVDAMLEQPSGDWQRRQAAYTEQGYSYDEAQVKVGEEFGVTLLRRDDLIVSSNPLRPTSLERVTASAKAAGITISIETDPAAAPTHEDINGQAGTHTLDALNQDLHDLPVEYYAMSGLRHIILYAKPPENDTIEGGYVRRDTPGVAHINVRTGDSLLEHEAGGHLFADVYCGDATNDPAYFDISGQIYQKNSKNSPITYDAYAAARHAKAKEMAGDSGAAGASTLEQCDLLSELTEERKRVHVVRDYSLEGILEDGATLAEKIAEPTSYAEIFDPMKPLSEKARLWAARMYDADPDVVEFLMSQATRPADC